MCENSAKVEPIGMRVNVRDRILQIRFSGKPNAAHPRINRQMDAKLVTISNKFLGSRQPVGFRNGNGDILGRSKSSVFRTHNTEHQQWLLETSRAQRECLIQYGNTESARPGRSGNPCDPQKSMSVRIRLNHSKQFTIGIQ